jgi:hypothetical protein
MSHTLQPNRKDEQNKGALRTSEGATYKRSGSSAQSTSVCSHSRSLRDSISIPTVSQRTALEANLKTEKNVQYKRVKSDHLGTSDKKSTFSSVETDLDVSFTEWSKQFFEHLKRRNSKSYFNISFKVLITLSVYRCSDSRR